MQTVQFINLTRGTSLGREIGVADNLRTRFMGLMGKSHLPEGRGLQVSRCSLVHTFFMRMPLDVVYLDAGMRVVKAVPNLKPWRISFGANGAKSVLELPAGTIQRSRTEPGDQLGAGSLPQ
ncbi:MAG TPA: DUF192 domain-containing protein [Dehalococcoidia bacterium]